MKLFLALAVVSIIVSGLLFMPSYFGRQADTQNSQAKIIPDEYIVVLKKSAVDEGETGAEANAQIKQNMVEKAQEANVTLQSQGGYVDKVYDLAIQGYSVKNVNNPLALLADPDVDYIEPNTLEPIDTQYSPTNLDRIDVDKAATATNKPDNRETKLNIDVAVIDSQVHPHPDLNVFKTVRMLTPADRYLQTHGTHVAGTCCARDNLGGIVGVAQGARIWSLVVCGGEAVDECSGDAMISAFNYVIQNSNQIEVATMSAAGGTPEPQSRRDAVTAMLNSGVTFTRSAGNTGNQCPTGWGCDHPTAIVVSNMQDFDGKCGGKSNLVNSAGTTFRDDTIAATSTWGSQIDIMAPGTMILSTIPNAAGESYPNPTAFPYIGMSEQGFYAFMSGTSMATPSAAGVAALIKLKNPSFTPAQVKSNMQTNAYAQNFACDGSSKGGLVQGANAKGSEKILFAGNY